MPMYDYRCPHCQASYEQLVSYNRADEVPCPHCGYRYGLRRISKVAIRTSGASGNVGNNSSSCAGEFSSGGG